jgi:hypothetical protein
MLQRSAQVFAVASCAIISLSALREVRPLRRFEMRPTSFALLWAALVLSVPSVVWAEAAPPQGSKPLTEILRPIEARSDFAYFEEIELEDGRYKIEYYTKGGSKQKIEVDPLTGAPREDSPPR